MNRSLEGLDLAFKDIIVLGTDLECYSGVTAFILHIDFELLIIRISYVS